MARRSFSLWSRQRIQQLLKLQGGGDAMMMPTPEEKLDDAALARVIDWILRP